MIINETGKSLELSDTAPNIRDCLTQGYYSVSNSHIHNAKITKPISQPTNDLQIMKSN